MKVYALTVNAKNREQAIYDFGEDLEMAFFNAEREFNCSFDNLNYELKPAVKIWHVHCILTAKNTISPKKLMQFLGYHINLQLIKATDKQGLTRWKNYISKGCQTVAYLEMLDMERNASYQSLFDKSNISSPLDVA